MSLNLIDILFLLTVILLFFNGIRNGAVFSLINLISIPVAFAVAYFYGAKFTALLAASGLPATPLISYIVIFIGTVLVLHIVGTMIRGMVRAVPFVGLGDALLGGLIGIGEAWLLWLVLLTVLGAFLHNVQGTIQTGTTVVPGLNIQVDQFRAWHDFYNQALNNSLFARFNSFFVKELPALPTLIR
ncbi:MAG TPA: CvpA family protein [Ktedonobacteraceae bacterium]|jgi:uncharacterized membrane protein required for colicin V production|nr:CvpA family protein [Ktedonobacteraceae bacterium]